MDGTRFDGLVKSLAAGSSRRSVLGALAGAMLGAAGLSRSADAKSCRSLGNSCDANDDCCSGNCVAEGRTRNICHCSSPSDCPAGDQCHTPTCTGGACGLQVTPGASCGDGDACTTGNVCQANGTCAGIPVVCTTPNDCFTPGTCQGGSCSAPIYHGDQTLCAGGVCFQQQCCVPNALEVSCAGKCGTQTNNCGQSVACPPCCTAANGPCQTNGACCSSVCVEGICADGPGVDGAVCDDDGDCLNQHCCGGVCHDLANDPDHCGGCETVCSSNHMTVRNCASGICAGTCASDYRDCNGNLQIDGCETNIANGDPANCGSCGFVCPTGPNAVATCVASQCQFNCLAANFANCDDNPATGCEIDLDTDNDNCGACGRRCAAGEACSGGVCLCGSAPACDSEHYCTGGVCQLVCPAGTCGGACAGCAGGPDGSTCFATGNYGCSPCNADRDCAPGAMCIAAFFNPDRTQTIPPDPACVGDARGVCGIVIAC